MFKERSTALLLSWVDVPDVGGAAQTLNLFRGPAVCLFTSGYLTQQTQNVLAMLLER